ncbi:MAG TPA: M48 family metalloprotease [Vicinamibacterales bacterium]|nr:M48 family metalloprotease [Vicinamibacterales bacterium]HPW22218.1 M48 family metalloprotease [Vicinamibacterales bacterium]
MNEDRAGRYHRLRRRAAAGSAAWTAAWLIVLLLTGWSRNLSEAAGRMTAGLPSALRLPGAVIVWALAVAAVHEAGRLPFACYNGFILERRYGLSRQQAAAWLADHLKSGLVGLAFALAASVWVAACLQRWPDGWWLPAWAGAAAAAVAAAWAAPVLVLPLFCALQPLRDEALRRRLLALAARAGVPAIDIVEWRLSGRSSRANAALVGLGRTRRIVVSDTLASDYRSEEVEAVVAHELAHRAHRDIWFALGIDAAQTAAALLASDAALRAAAGPLSLAGAPVAAGLPIVALVSLAVGLLSAPAAHALSRARERRADRYALDLTGNADAFARAVRRLGAHNLAEEHPGPLARAFFHTHPPVEERLAAARAWAAARGAGPATGSGT